MTQHSLYLHIPFCRHKCSYCDFNTYAGLESLMGDYVRALCREIELLAATAGERLPVHTIFFGGGTPSLVPAPALAAILQALDAAFNLEPALEVSLEANPGTLAPAYLRDLRALGVNRLSLGMQSAQPEELDLLEREHDFGDVARAVAWARRAGFDNLNLDLIFGLPGQPLERWRRTLDLALGLEPDHLSLYALSLEHGTPLQGWVNRGLLPEPEADQAAEMYEWAAARLGQAGYLQYEISNWARRDDGRGWLVCRHNLQYWRNRPYLGLGAGAHGFAAGRRTANVLGPRVYIRRCLSGEARPFPLTPATAQARAIDRFTEMQETLLMGLRLTAEGVSRREFQERFGEPLERVFSREVGELIGMGLLEWGGEEGEILRLTRRGRQLGNRVFMRFV